jgi:hypothetical protein
LKGPGASGNGDAEFVHAVACQSFQAESIVQGEAVGLHRRLHQYGGFHGSVIMYPVANSAGDFAEDAFDQCQREVAGVRAP